MKHYGSIHCRLPPRPLLRPVSESGCRDGPPPSAAAPSGKEVGAVQHGRQVQRPAGGHGGERQARVPLPQRVVQPLEHRLLVELDEALTQKPVHGVHVSCMRPVRVVHSCKVQTRLVHLDGRHHHVGGVQAVHEVGREGRALPLGGHRQRVVRARQLQVLHQRLHHVPGVLAVGLDDGQAQRGDPGHGRAAPRAGHQRRAVREPVHDAPRLLEDLSYAFHG
mmetsp:Transcript_50199/g.73333  ORF Transcript_50199/g.73333 Transcript_50199/m.73333 type:complete len:221 (-) Transcript_50199:670-1332(-)